MPSRDWWSSLFATIDGKRSLEFAGFLTPDGEFRFGSQPAVHGQANVAAYVDAFFGMIGGSRHELLRTWDADGSTVCEGLVTYTRLDGTQVTVPASSAGAGEVAEISLDALRALCCAAWQAADAGAPLRDLPTVRVRAEHVGVAG